MKRNAQTSGWLKLNKSKPLTLRNKKKVKRTGQSSLPPIIPTTVTVGHTYRFAVSSLANVLADPITATMLGGVCGVIGTVTNSKVQPMASSIRVRRVTIWPGAETTPPVTPAIEWGQVAGIVKDEAKVGGVPYGITVERAVTSTPPKHSLGADWINIGTLGSTIVFYLSAPAGSIVDVSLSWTLANVFVTPTNITVSTAVIGTMYYLALDGPLTHVMAPMGLPTTT